MNFEYTTTNSSQNESQDDLPDSVITHTLYRKETDIAYLKRMHNQAAALTAKSSEIETSFGNCEQDSLFQVDNDIFKKLLRDIRFLISTNNPEKALAKVIIFVGQLSVPSLNDKTDLSCSSSSDEDDLFETSLLDYLTVINNEIIHIVNALDIKVEETLDDDELISLVEKTITALRSYADKLSGLIFPFKEGLTSLEQFYQYIWISNL